MKKILALLLALTLVFSFCACGKNNAESGGEAANGQVSVWIISGINDQDGTHTFEIVYDDTHELCKIVYYREQPDSSLVKTECQYLFDEQGRILSDGQVSAGKANFTCCSYDQYGNEIKAGMTYQYDEKGKILSATDTRTNETTTYTYNENGRVTQALGVLEEHFYTYDAAGRLTEKKSTNGWKEVYTYDDLGRLVKSESGYEDEPAWVETYTYDDKGNITKIVAQSEDYNEGNPITYEIEYKQVFVSENRAKALNAQKDYISGKLMTLAW